MASLSAFILSFNISISPALSQTVLKCEQHQEILTFQLSNYPIQDQGVAVLNVKFPYCMTPEVLAQNTYHDFVPIRKDIDKFFINYPNEGDFWEILNKKLVQILLDKYPKMVSLSIEIGVTPNVQEPLYCFTIVQSTRPQNCLLNL